MNWYHNFSEEKDYLVSSDSKMRPYLEINSKSDDCFKFFREFDGGDRNS